LGLLLEGEARNKSYSSLTYYNAISTDMPKYKIIDLGFSTADGAQPEIQFVRGDIHFSFLEWEEQPVRFIASDVRAFSWLEELDIPSLRDDVTYEVDDSDLIQKYYDWNAMSPKDGYRHFKLCFNAAGVFDVVCKTITVIRPPEK